MTKFMRDELNRLVQKIPETDPCSGEYHVLLHSIECLDSMGQMIEEILAAVFEGQAAEDLGAEKLDVKEGAELISAIKSKADGKVVPFTAPDFPEELPAETPVEQEEKTYDPSEVRKALVDAKKKGVDIKVILAKVGADNFQAVPAAKYGIIMKELEVVE